MRALNIALSTRLAISAGVSSSPLTILGGMAPHVTTRTGTSNAVAKKGIALQRRWVRRGCSRVESELGEDWERVGSGGGGCHLREPEADYRKQNAEASLRLGFVMEGLEREEGDDEADAERAKEGDELVGVVTDRTARVFERIFRHLTQLWHSVGQEVLDFLHLRSKSNPSSRALAPFTNQLSVLHTMSSTRAWHAVKGSALIRFITSGSCVVVPGGIDLSYFFTIFRTAVVLSERKERSLPSRQ